MLDTALFNKTSMTLEQKEQVVRMLTQSPCLPFLDDKEVKIEKSPGFLLKIEQDLIRIGDNYTDGPVGMVLLRYAIEWHIWHLNTSDTATLTTCDLAAAKVTSLFLSFFSRQDQDTVYRCMPRELIDALAWAKGTILSPEECEPSHLKYLASLRSDDTSGAAPTLDQLEIVAAIAAPTEYHFTHGGDVRLLVDKETRLNVYGCLPFPRNNAFTFASSTSTSVSSYAYAESEKQRQRIIQRCLESVSLRPIAQFTETITDRLAHVFGLSDLGCEFLISPSGTDSQLHAIAIMSSVLKRPAVSIVAAADETASGTPYSTAGQHFYNVTCLGVAVNKGHRLAGLPEIKFQAIPQRDSAGQVRSMKDMDSAVWERVSNCVQRQCDVLLHVMDQSKHGCYSPSHDLLEHIRSEFGERVQVVVDACQARIDSMDIRRFLEEGHIVLLTGSKFYTGPPFSGAAVFPRSLVERIEKTTIGFPEGLADYLCQSDLGTWARWLDSSPAHNGIGMHLRWWAALAEIARYHEVPVELRRLALDVFCQRAERIIKEAGHTELMFQLGDEQYAKTNSYGTELSSRRTIFPFRVLSNGKYLNPAETKQVYELLNQDISSLITGTSEELRLAARCCHIGQPVQTTGNKGEASATLRISAGARIVSESWLYRDAGMFFKKVEEESNQIEFIVQKIGLILTKGLHEEPSREPVVR